MDDIRNRFNVNRGDYGARGRNLEGGRQQPRPHATPQPRPVTNTNSQPAQPAQPKPASGRPMQDFRPMSPQPKVGQGFGPFNQQTQSPRPQQGTPKKPQSSSPFDGPATTIKPNKPKAKKGKKSLKVFAVVALLLIGLGGGGFYGYNKYYQDPRLDSQVAGVNSEPVPAPQEQVEEQPTGTITLLMTGDFIAYDSVNIRAKSGNSYDYAAMLAPMKPILEKHDLRLCQQTTLGGGVELGVSGYPIFNAPLEWNSSLVGTGCNIMATASRNAADKGQQAITNAANFYGQSSVLAHSGVNASVDTSGVQYFEHQNVKFAFVSYTTSSIKPKPNDFSVNTYSKAVADKQLTEAREQADFVIVAINWGVSDEAAVQQEQKVIAQELTTAGADLIVGSGPHITQYAEILQGKEGRQSLVWYSLGNALSSQLQAENRFGGVGIVNIDIATRNMTDPSFLPTYMHYEWTPAQKAANDFDSRTNLGWYPLDQAKDILAKSLLDTSIEAQLQRLTSIITSKAPITVITSADIE